MVQLLQNLADEFADFAQGVVCGNPLLRMNVRKHPALILRPSAHPQSSRRIRGELNHHSFALARFFSKLLGVQVIEIGAKKFMCVGALPPQDHPHVYCDMGEDAEYVCPYCSTLYRHDPALAPNQARPAECEF